MHITINAQRCYDARLAAYLQDVSLLGAMNLWCQILRFLGPKLRENVNNKLFVFCSVLTWFFCSRKARGPLDLWIKWLPKIKFVNRKKLFLSLDSLSTLNAQYTYIRLYEIRQNTINRNCSTRSEVSMVSYHITTRCQNLEGRDVKKLQWW
jgi:hypothetical protein